MELGKHERQVTGKEALERKQTVTSQESETKPLTFTFVPSIGRLPTHFEVVDISKFLVTVPEEPKDLSNQGILNKSSAVSHELAVNSGARQDCVSAVHTDSTRTIFQSPGCNASKGEMQENDLFKAEFILITDSGDEDEVAAVSNNIHRPSNGYGPISAQLLATSHVSPGAGAGKPAGDGHVPGAAFSLSTADQQKHQLISTLSISDHLSSKPPAVHLISPTNQKIACGAVVNLNQASSLEDSCNNWQSNSSSPRPEQSATSLVLKCRSPVSDKSPDTLPSRPRELTSPQSFSLPSDRENIKPKQYKIKTSYKAFAAIPTNTLLMEQKALEEPTKTASVTEGTALDTHSEMCSPAQLRQQTEELCAVIDQVLQDPLTMRRCESSPSFLQMSTESDVGKVSTTLQRAAGRETRYANLYKSAPVMTESQLTKPGVIRPVLVKAKSAQQKEEPYQPNPFKKYLEEIRDQDTEQETGLPHPLHPTKMIPPTKSPLRPSSVSLTDYLNPGPFSHLSSIVCDFHENPYSPYSHNSLYNKKTKHSAQNRLPMKEILFRYDALIRIKR
ncbi:muscular LMNA-interacting protein isoform B [Patagioenas fasciata monilis]|uniref:Muscular LMNA-interacting protein isoform B n=1 Tax=Patagioenas fasciata monilis TaxID=372326 RepID=A0A1V4JMQ0_PATFA|nr:muscular LMNA-interacting protein isoform B [Patagioenas fasciata monilis]